MLHLAEETRVFDFVIIGLMAWESILQNLGKHFTKPGKFSGCGEVPANLLQGLICQNLGPTIAF